MAKMDAIKLLLEIKDGIDKIEAGNKIIIERITVLEEKVNGVKISIGHSNATLPSSYYGGKCNGGSYGK